MGDEKCCNKDDKCSGCGCKKCCCCCCTNLALMVSGFIFGVLSLMYLYRFFAAFPVIIGTWAVPDQVSLVAFIVAGLLSAWMFWSAKKLCDAKHHHDHTNCCK